MSPNATRKVWEEEEISSGLGTLCPEAQADGVPCTDIGKLCEECERRRAQIGQDQEQRSKQPPS